MPLATRLVDHHHGAAVGRAKLLVRIEQLDSVHSAVRSDIDVEPVAYSDRLDLGGLLLKAEPARVWGPDKLGGRQVPAFFEGLL